MQTIANPLQPLSKPPSMHQSVREAIRRYIIDNNLKPGDSLPSENQLSQQLGVSRNLVREAVRGLEAVGVINIRRGSGLYVNQFSFEPLISNLHYGLLIDMQELLDMLEIRRVLESGLIGKAIEQMTSDDMKQLEQALYRMQLTQQDYKAFVNADRQFHQALFTCLENTTLLKVLDAFWLTFNKAAQQHWEALRGDPAETYANHAHIVNAVLAKDINSAQAAIENHYTAVETRLRQRDNLDPGKIVE